MQRIFVPDESFSGDSAVIASQDHIHLTRVLRLGVGDTIVLINGRGAAFRAEITSVDKSSTAARILADEPMPPEPAASIVVAQALGKAGKFESVIQHGTEIGATAFVPVRAERCVADVPKEPVREAQQRERWKLIAKGAAEQCGRSRIPEVLAAVRSAELFKASSGDEHLRILLEPGAQTPLKEILSATPAPLDRITFCIGPEGGWSPGEISAAAAGGWRCCSLGPYVLRTETAALVALSQMFSHFGTELYASRSE